MICCERCIHHTNCVKKWMLGEKGLSQTCCVECPDFSDCFDDNMKKRWEIIHRAEDSVVVDRGQGSWSLLKLECLKS